jgi:hypothetical protein
MVGSVAEEGRMEGGREPGSTCMGRRGTGVWDSNRPGRAQRCENTGVRRILRAEGTHPGDRAMKSNSVN